MPEREKKETFGEKTQKGGPSGKESGNVNERDLLKLLSDQERDAYLPSDEREYQEKE